MNTKTITLISGCDEGFSWNSGVALYEDGTFRGMGVCFNVRNNQVRYQKYNEKMKLQHKEYQKSEKGKEVRKSYDKTEQGKLIKVRAKAKRRALGFVQLNDNFPGAEAHHLDKELVLYIPAELHRSVYHNQFTGQGMNEMNNLACEYVYGIKTEEVNA